MKEPEKIHDKELIRECREGLHSNFLLKHPIGYFCLISDKYLCPYQKKEEGKYLRRCTKW